MTSDSSIAPLVRTLYPTEADRPLLDELVEFMNKTLQGRSLWHVSINSERNPRSQQRPLILAAPVRVREELPLALVIPGADGDIIVSTLPVAGIDYRNRNITRHAQVKVNPGRSVFITIPFTVSYPVRGIGEEHHHITVRG